MSKPRSTPHGPRDRRGSALILVLIMTLSLAGLAMSAIYLTSSANLLTRYYDRERNYRYAAEQALALGKSRVNKDTSLHLPDDTALAMLTGATLSDAYGSTIGTIQVNLYGAYTGDTVGRYGNFVTLLATAFDVGGTRHVRRLDLSSESFSRFAMFTNKFPSNLCYGTGEFIRGRAHSNQLWNSCGPPGPDYYDTVSAVTTISGTANYHGIPNLPGSPSIPIPTVSKLSALPGYASGANLAFTPVSGTGSAVTQGSADLSGRVPGTSNTPKQGTRVSFKMVDVDGAGAGDESEGMMMIFDLAAGMDTSTLRADLPRSAPTPITSIVLMNQCGLMVTIAGRKEFFPVARFKEQWVRSRIMLSTSPTFAAADTTAMDSTAAAPNTSAARMSKIMSYGPGFSRCFPPGNPYLMLTERYVTAAGSCTVTTATTVTPYGWGSPGAGTGGCTTAQQYGGQDTTFTAVVTRCNLWSPSGTTSGVCAGNQVALGAWRAWAGTALPAVQQTLWQAVETPFLWPFYKPYNLNSKGVIHSTAGPLYMSDTLRGNVTVYVLGTVVFIDDLVYDIDPTTAICRNFLGVIARDDVYLADNSMNRPRPDTKSIWRFMGPNLNFYLHGVTMSLNGTVGVENWGFGTSSTYAGAACGGNPQSGGCIDQTGGVIEQDITATYAGNYSGLRENRTVDPCQKTNRKPPFFPSTGRYLDNKYYEIDPTNVSTWAQVKAFYARLRG